MPVGEIAELEATLGHTFRDPRLLVQALTHSSRLPELTPQNLPVDNERLEFLGDAVLELLVSEELIRVFPAWSEGDLSKSRARLVNSAAVAQAARRLYLGNYLRLGRGEEKTGGREKPALLADAYEAVLAAIYLDAGLDAARQFVHRTLTPTSIAAEAERLGRADYKSTLQEYLQARGILAGSYAILEEEGPDHAKTFHVEVRISGEIAAVGSGRTKKEAEQSAALAALIQLGVEGV